MTVYSPSECDGNLRGAAGTVYKESEQNQMDMRNHNPRVGGSSPSSATIKPPFPEIAEEPVYDLPVNFPKKPRGFAAKFSAYEAGIKQRADERERLWLAEMDAMGSKFGWCYFARDLSGAIKIGYSRIVNGRLNYLRSMGHTGIHLLVKTTGGSERELYYHAKFSDHRLSGEWFAPHPDILAEIDRLKALPQNDPETARQRCRGLTTSRMEVRRGCN